jgi:cell wall-associated NlpC family hydrolase
MGGPRLSGQVGGVRSLGGRFVRRFWVGAALLTAVGSLVLASAPVASAASPATPATPAASGGATGGPIGAETSSTGLLSTNFWLASAQGNVWSFGHAAAYGSAGALPLADPIVAITPTNDERGYWLVASDGGVFTYGDAAFYGSTGALALNKPIVAMASTPDGRGYWLVASDGGIFSFGDAAFYGSTGALVLNKPIAAMAPTPDGRGYWLMASDGGIFTFGDAAFYGSTAAVATTDPAEKIVAMASGQGYWIEDQNGTMYPFGTAQGAPPSAGLMFQPVTPGDRAVLFAFSQLGKPYIWGGNGPVGYDCSGLALASWQHGTGVTFARVADDQYHTAGVAVTPAQLSAGDLVFWGTSQTDWTTVYHTALYVGGDQIVESTDGGVQLNSLGQWGQGDIMPAGRRP